MRVNPYVSFKIVGFFAAACLTLFSSPVQAQPVVLGAGYSNPQPINVSPGQLITIFARVPGKQVSAPVAVNPPLPTSLGGFSVLLRQSFIDPALIPIQSVSDVQSCSMISPQQCDTVSLITVQIPFELVPNIPHTSLPQSFARLEINYNGSQTSSLFLNPVPDVIHVLNTCDAAAGVVNKDACAPVISHSDGTLVTRDTPALPGETVTMSLVGMGQPQTRIPTGSATPQSPPQLDGVTISFDARTNASPSALSPTASFPVDAARLKPGSVGIYEIPFMVPALPPGVPACSSTVLSNMTVNISRTTSFDGVGICVLPNAI